VAYRVFAVLEFNTARIPGRGSAMFLHVDTGHATNGCVSLPRGRLVRVLRWLRPGATIRITA
jgi:L,D-peptidoglycan transpeptidase YkuD (ErfK/YbiS/YcfS/YnhG family)